MFGLARLVGEECQNRAQLRVLKVKIAPPGVLSDTGTRPTRFRSTLGYLEVFGISRFVKRPRDNITDLYVANFLKS